MTLRIRLLLALALPAGLASCASAPEGAYPSLAIRDIERVSGTLAPPDPPPAPEPLAPATLQRLDSLTGLASEAHAQFLAAAPGTRQIAQNTGAIGSESWARAQVALADLQAVRSQAMIALADLDRLYVDAMTGGTDAVQPIAAARDSVIEMVAEEDRVIAALAGSLR